MFRLVKYELKKIIKNKVNIASIGIMLLIVLYSFVPKIINYKTTTEEGITLEGRAAVVYEKSYLDEKFTEPLSTEKIIEDIGELKKLIRKTDEEFYDPKKHMDEKDYKSFFLPRGEYYSWLSESYEGLDDKSYWLISDLINFNGKYDDFYHFRLAKIKNKLEKSEVIKGNFKEAEYWANRAELTNGPYNYAYHEGWSTINDSLDVYTLLLLIVVAISLSGVFARENESNMISIILSSKNGRRKLAKAKVLASALYIAVLSFIMIGIITLPNLIFFGVSGWNLPVQILNSTILYKWNLLGLYLIRIMISLITALSFGAVCLFLSTITKKTYVVNVLALVFIIASFLLPDFRNRLFIQIAMTLPLQLNGVLYYSYISYSVLGKIFNIYQLGPILHILTILFFAFMTIITFNKQELN